MLSLQCCRALRGIIALGLTAFCMTLSINLWGQQSTPNPALRMDCKGEYKHVTLSAVAHELMKTGKVNILIDGEPLQKTADFQFNGTVQEALDAIADAFDYNWKTNKRGIVLMNKRFKNADERPQMNLREMRQMAKDVVDALHIIPLDPDLANGYKPLNAMVTTLNVEQEQALRAGKNIKGAELLPMQRDLLEAAAAHAAFAPTAWAWDSYYDVLMVMPLSYIEARRLQAVESSGAGVKASYLLMHVATDKSGKPHMTPFNPILFREDEEQKKP